jgi:hypothetical protein
MSKLSYLVAVTAVSLACAGTSFARQDDGEETAREGVAACGLANHLRQGGTEIHFTSYALRNLGSTPITIDRLEVFAGTGAVVFDSQVDGFPVFTNDRLGPADQVLDPKQTAELDTDSFLPFIAEALRPLTVVFSWSASERVLTLSVSAIRLVRQRDPATGQQLAERARTGVACRNISLRP